MSDRNLVGPDTARLRHCGTKVRHATREDALDHIKRLVWKNSLAGASHRSAGLAPYPCDYCGSWHVGHEQTAPLAWHYTVCAKLDAIMESGALKVPRPFHFSRQTMRRVPHKVRKQLKTAEEPAPLLWLSRNPEWEHSVIKSTAASLLAIGGSDPRSASLDIPDLLLRGEGRETTELLGGGLLRFGVPACFAKLRWSDYLARNPIPSDLRDVLAARGDPTEWLATDEHVPLDVVRAVQVYFRGAWVQLDEAADDFDGYLEGRRAVYDAARESLQQKADAVLALSPRERAVQLAEPERILWDDLERRARERAFYKENKKGGALSSHA